MRPDACVRQHSADFGALAAAGLPSMTTLHAESDLLVACHGRMQWGEQRSSDTPGTQNAARAIAELYKTRTIPELMEEIHGRFCLSIIDRLRQRALLAIDRLGIDSLFYSRTDNGNVYFASSATCLAATNAVRPEISAQGVYDYLYFHMVPSPRSIYTDLRKLLPGQYLVVENGACHTDHYWTVPYREHDRTPYRALKLELMEQLRSATARSLSNQKIAAFLSGGTDSSTVAGILRELQSAAPPTYSIGFDAEGFDETEFARISAAHFGTDHHEYYVTPQDVTDAIPTIAAAYDEPFGNASAIPAYYCAKRAHDDGVEVMLAGDGGDELFAGNARYATQKVFEAYQLAPRLLRNLIVEPLLMNTPGSCSIPILRKARSYIEQARIPLPDRLETYNFLHRTAPTEIFSPDFLDGVDPNEPIQIIREAYCRTASAHPLHRMLHLDLKNTLADNDLRKVTRMCELAGIEVRYPLLDEKLVEFSAHIHPRLQLQGLKLRYFFKKALSDFLPKATVKKSKHGFGLPFGLWLRDYKPLRDLALDSLDSLQRRDIIKPQYIQSLMQLHRKEHASYYGVMIWVLMMLEQWFQTRNHG